MYNIIISAIKIMYGLIYSTFDHFRRSINERIKTIDIARAGIVYSILWEFAYIAIGAIVARMVNMVVIYFFILIQLL